MRNPFAFSLSGVVSGGEIKAADIGIILDGSKWVRKKNFMRQLELVKLIIRSFSVSKEEVHFGIATAANDGKVVIQLDAYLDETSLQEAVAKISYPAGRRLVGKAISKTRDELFSRGRAGVSKILLIFVGGRSGDGVEVPSTEIKKGGIRVVVVGMGRKIDETQLVTITSKPEFIIIQRYIQFLTSIIAPLVAKLNEGTDHLKVAPYNFLKSGKIKNSKPQNVIQRITIRASNSVNK